MHRRHAFALAGALLSAGAPAGLLALRLAVDGNRSRRSLISCVRGELTAQRTAYLYVATSTALAFGAFGYLLGRQADRLALLSQTDGLTGLTNARGLYERLHRELARTRRYPAPLALLVMDLDGLKAVNDRYGHRMGDEALRNLAAIVRSELRESDVGARWGGDEFAIVAPNTSRDAALALGERIRSVVVRRSTPLPLSVSLGVAMFDPETDLEPGPEALMHAADRALYEAKARGRNRVAVAASRP